MSNTQTAEPISIPALESMGGRATLRTYDDFSVLGIESPTVPAKQEWSNVNLALFSSGLTSITMMAEKAEIQVTERDDHFDVWIHDSKSGTSLHLTVACR
jgi:hypothetical protein